MTKTRSSPPSFLVLTNKNVVHRLPEWFPDARSELVLATTPAAISASGLTDPARHFRHVHLVGGFNELPAEEELFKLCRQFQVRRILSTGEREVLLAARLRQRLDLPGIDVATATAFRDKFVMKSLVAEAGITVAPMRRVQSADELRDFALQVGYPVVIKPLDGGGSAGIRVIGDAHDLTVFTDGPKGAAWPEPMLTEAWVEGDIYQLNGLMLDGDITLGQPFYTAYTGWDSVRLHAALMGAMLPENHPLSNRLKKTTARVLQALPTVFGVCAFHAEFFHTPDDRLVLCEIACRAGGAGIVDIHEGVFGVNLHGASLLGQARRGNPQAHYPALGPLQGTAYFPPSRGILRRISRHCPLPNVLTYSVTGECGRTYAGTTSHGPTVATMTFTLPTSDVRSELGTIDRWWRQNTVWETR